MGKIAFIYPGQGSQTPGMGQDFYENGKLARRVFDLADKVLDFDVKQVCFTKNTLLDNTAYTQPALVATCLAITEEIKALGIKPQVTAGLSLGEYAAIATAGCMSIEDAIRTVRTRGILMDQAVPRGEGSMAAVLGMTGEAVNQVVEHMQDVMIANYNCPGQIVITGKKQAVEEAMEKLTENGARRVIELNVSGPFHSSFLKEAGRKLGVEVEKLKLEPPVIPYVANFTAELVSDKEKVRNLLEKQVYSSVLWEQSMRNMISHGVDTFIEIGPGRTLAGFLRKIDSTVKVINVGQYEDLPKCVKFSMKT